MRSKDPSTLRITDLWKFKSTKSNKWYIVEMEYISRNLIAVKFYYKGVRWSDQRYSLLTGDYEPRTIVYSCLELMKRYYLKDDTVSFGFVAAEDIDPQKRSSRGNRRFRFYRTVVNYYFGTKTFVHLQDESDRLYLLLNKKQIMNGSLVVKDEIDNINNIYEGDFNFSWD
ncbi:MAG: hypothetical protein K2J63_04715 [Muribaculaceae bacterium]|nr:hypothetical protein [Muribaculaceae bacterium]